MQLYFIRHGQSINNANSDSETYQEHSDPYLTMNGKQQARLLAEYLKNSQKISNPASRNLHNEYGFGFTHIYTSLMERAVETASYTARALGNIPFTAWVEIHEEGGIYAREEGERFNGLPGKPRSFFETNFPELELPTSLSEAGWWNRPFEDEIQRQPRADKVLAELLAKHGDKEGQPEERIVFVSHGGFFVRFLSAVLQLPWRQGAHGLRSWFMLHNCSISRFDFQKDYAMISYVNNTSHLPAELITG
ncbi:MAG: histidine phosphatase family protein [Anaerolineales bacterium]|jgi:2,3-bisphosphoglycerate-dependent phosphoglycerate mutase|uniref:histidine phosphatase family protein n=1 Tax=Candidatus Villigracilis vicinus TaxID=3140679 RepID=UPI0031373936|nr:histidine phosphatase family protein [Anaerolineales bacterium]MBK7448661.1 histidine phosphatase family protein [Anaerolineales bacterium]